MNRNVSMAVGMAAAMVFSSVAHANNTQTINNSSEYVPLSIAMGFVPAFVTTMCQSASGATGLAVVGGSGSCASAGLMAVAAAAGVDIGAGIGGYFGNPNLVPVFNSAAYLAGMEHSGYKLAAPFSNGLFTTADGGAIRDGRSSYFDGLENAWADLAEAQVDGDRPMGVGELGGDHTLRELWIDQLVVGYVESLDPEDNPNYELNLRSQLSWNGSNLTNALAHIDQRLEQDLTLDAGGNPFEASRQTLQMAFAADSRTGATTNPGGGSGGSVHTETGGLGQLTTQDVNGWFWSCINCDTPDLGEAVHAFEPLDQVYSFMPYDTSWRSVPSIQHAAASTMVNPTIQ